MYPDRLGDFIAREREKFYPSRRVFAKKIGLDPTTIENIENGDTKSPGLHVVLAIAKGLKTSPLRLIAIYEGQDPDKVDDGGVTLQCLLMEFVRSLPSRILEEALKADAMKGLNEKVLLAKMMELKGKEQFKKLVAEVESGI